MIYEIYTYGGGDYVIEVLNAVVRIMGDNSFNTALKISLLFGLVSVMFDIAINGNFTKGLKYYISFLLLYNVLFVPKVDILIVDSIKQVTNNRKIDNVPFGLAFTANVITSFGYWMTEKFGMNFALPNDLQYNNSGLLFGSSILKDTLNKNIENTNVSNNLNNFIRQCIIQKANIKTIDIQNFVKSKNIQEFLDFGKSGIFMYEYKSNNNETKFLMCKDTTELSKDINNEIDKMIDYQQLKLNVSGDKNLSIANQYILNIQQDTTRNFEQSIIANAINNSTQEYLAITGANAGAINYAITKDDIQKEQTGIIQWLQAGKYLPLLKIVIETIFFSLFPVVVLLMLLPNGFKIFKNYILILLALQLWSPLYAILNLIMTLEQKFRLSSLIQETGSTISLYNKQGIMNVINGIEIQASLLAFSIPVLSFKIIQGLQGVGETMAGNIASAGAYSMSNVVGEITAGNLSYGNGSMRNLSYDNINYNNDTANQFKKMNVSFTSTEDQVNSNRLALNDARSTNQSFASSYNKSLEDLQNFTFTDSSGNEKTHSFSDSDMLRGHIGVGGGKFIKAGIDYEKAMSWADSHNISEEDRKTLSDLIQKTNNFVTSYNNSLMDVSSKQKELSYSLATSTHSGINWDKKVYDYLINSGYNEEWINNNPLEAQKIGDKYIRNEIFNDNKPNMLTNIDNNIDLTEKQYYNQDNMIDAQYDYKKNSLNNNNQLHQMKNTEFSNLDWNIKRNNN